MVLLGTSVLRGTRERNHSSLRLNSTSPLCLEKINTGSWNDSPKVQVEVDTGGRSGFSGLSGIQVTISLFVVTVNSGRPVTWIQIR